MGPGCVVMSMRSILSVTSEVLSAQVFITIHHHNYSSIFRVGMLTPSSCCIYMVYEAKSHKTVRIKFMGRLRYQFFSISIIVIFINCVLK